MVSQTVEDFQLRTRGPLVSERVRAEGSSRVSLGYESYTSSSKPVYSDQLYEGNLLIDWGVSGEGKLSSSWRYNVDSSAVFSSGDEWVYPKIKDAYLSVSQFKLGFLNHSWSEFEEEWRMGLYRPRFMYNKLSGGQGGLPGVHFESGGFLLSALPLNMPELGPQFKEQDGELVSSNPWFGGLPETLTYNGTRAPIRYRVNMPEVKDVVLKPGVALSYTANLSPQSYSRFSAAYKPMPQILLNFPADRRFILSDERQYFQVEVEPLVAYHTLVSWDQVHQFNDSLKVKASLAYEVPDLPNRPRTWVTQELGPATYLSSRVEQSLGFLSQSKVFLSQFKVWGGDRPDEGRFATDQSFFETRQFFKEAYGLGVNYGWYFGRQMQSEVQVIYDHLQKGGVFRAHHNVQMNKSLSFGATLELMGLLGNDNPYPSGFLSDYRGNDRAELGVSYAF